MKEKEIKYFGDLSDYEKIIYKAGYSDGWDGMKTVSLWILFCFVTLVFVVSVMVYLSNNI